MDRIFEPYYTTKSKGDGTGLGLSVVHGIIKGLGGHIFVYSEPGEGSTFHLYIPTAPGDFLREESSGERTAPRGREHILLVDDEEAIIRMEERFLQKLGYQVSSRTGSVDALELFRNCPHRFDLVVTDMSMPNMSGAELAGKMLEIRMDIPIILCSGFSEVVSAEKAGKIGIREYIMKPVMMKELGVCIRTVLDQGKQL